MIPLNKPSDANNPIPGTTLINKSEICKPTTAAMLNNKIVGNANLAKSVRPWKRILSGFNQFVNIPMKNKAVVGILIAPNTK